MSGERFTAWLSADERASLRALAAKLNVSENFIVRMALRATLFGKPIPEYISSAARELSGNASNASNANKHTTGARA